MTDVFLQGATATAQGALGGASTQTNRNGDGISTPGGTNPPRTCWGEQDANDVPCFIVTAKPQQTVTQWRVTKGMIGIVIGANFSAYGSVNGTTQTQITLDMKLSKVSLPVVGGYDAAQAAGTFAAETVAPVLNAPDVTVDTSSPTGTTVSYATPVATDKEDPSPDVTCTPASGSFFTIGQTQVTCTARDANGNTSTDTFTVTVRGTQPVGGTIPATLALTLGVPASFGAFTRGTAKEYIASTRPSDERHVRPPRVRVEITRDLVRTGVQRHGGDRVQAVREGHRRPPHGRLQQDADLHPVHHDPVISGRCVG
jgi:X-Pro dipeptidyl-peptidase